MLELGSFDDFKIAQILLVPLVIAFTGFFIVKPACKKINLSVDLGNSENTAKDDQR